MNTAGVIAVFPDSGGDGSVHDHAFQRSADPVGAGTGPAVREFPIFSG